MGFLKLNTVNVLGHMILHYRGTTLYYRMFSDVPDLGSNNTTPICDNQKCLQVWPSVPWKEESKSTQVRTTAIKRLKGFYLFFIFIFLQTCQFILFYFIFYFILLYNTVLVLPYIDMNQPWVYMSSQSWTPLPPPTPYHLSGSSPCTSPKHPVSCIEHRLAICFLHDSIHVSMPFSQIIPPSPSPSESKSPLYTSVSLCCLAYRVIIAIFLNSIYMC